MESKNLILVDKRRKLFIQLATCPEDAQVRCLSAGWDEMFPGKIPYFAGQLSKKSDAGAFGCHDGLGSREEEEYVVVLCCFVRWRTGGIACFLYIET
jgi:hypothetical protein